MSNQLGCFGSVLYHNPEGRRCTACTFKEACGAAAAENKVALDKWYADLVADKKASRKRAVAPTGVAPVALTSAPKHTITSTSATTLVNKAGKPLNKKPAEFAAKWIDKGIDCKAYQSGINGFATCGNKFAAVAMQFLMAKTTCTKDDLIDEFVAKLKWGVGTAASHANIVFEAFEYLDIITVSGSTATLR